MKKLILFIDDARDLNRELFSYVSKMVEAEGSEFEIKALHPTKDALASLQNGELRPDVVLCNIEIPHHMPGMSGIDFFRAIKPLLGATPFIFITSHPTLEASIEALKEGAVDYLVKPLQSGEFKLAISRALRMAETANFFVKFGDDLTLQELEKRYIKHIVKTHPGLAKEEIAHILGINRKTLYRKEKEYGLENHNSHAMNNHNDTNQAEVANSEVRPSAPAMAQAN